jgi:hypothetical protein
VKKNAYVDLSSGVPMVVALVKNMYKSPGQVRSIFIDPGCTMMQGIGCPGPHVWNVEKVRKKGKKSTEKKNCI